MRWRRLADWRALFLLLCFAFSATALAGPETALREFASAQIKKGVRVLGFGGDGATWGNYSLGWNESSPTAAITLRYSRFRLDVAYVHDLGVERSGGVFGKDAHAVISALTFDYSAIAARKVSSCSNCSK